MNRHSKIDTFNTLTAASRDIATFRDPGHLLDWLHDRAGDPDRKNDVLQNLLLAAVSTGPTDDLAVEVLILALWPGLSTVRARLRGRTDADFLDAELIGGLALGIRRADPGQVRRVAATLLRNLERDVSRLLARQARPLPPAVDLEVPVDPGATEAVMARAMADLGDDGLLLSAVYLAGFSQKEAAAGLGISHEAARKRCQRAMRRLRDISDPEVPIG